MLGDLDAHFWANKNPFTIPTVPPIGSLNQIMEKLLRDISIESRCPERHVSAAIVWQAKTRYNILSTGINGNDAQCGEDSIPLWLHKEFCIHAEAQAILNLPSNFRKYNPIISYSSLSPCFQCASKLLEIGTQLHIYLDEYDDRTGINLLLNKDIPVYRIYNGCLCPVDENLIYTQSFRFQKKYWREEA